jgi:GTPase
MTPEGAQSIRGPVASLPTGPYRYDVAADRWMLAGTTRNILGLGPDARVDASTLLGLLAEEEREQVARLVIDAIAGQAPFSTLHHVTRPDGTREVLVVGEAMCDEGRLTAVHGHVVDVGGLVTGRANARIDQAIADVVANRATIEQAKGALSLAYGFDGDGAIALLRWWSSRHNVKVTVLADRLVSAVGTGALSRPQLRAAVDALLASVAALDALNDGVVD